jgi:hypothetical protein
MGGKGAGGECGGILFTHVWKWKMRPAETIPGMGKGGEWCRGWI